MASKRLWSLALYILLTWLLLVFIVSRTTLSAQIYNAFIVKMTSEWYRAVLSDLSPNSVVLDVGIGTAGALMTNDDLIQKKNLRIYGIDITPQYVQAAQEAIQLSSLEKQVQVARYSIHDVPSIQSWLGKNQNIDVVYFSGSFSLLPDSLQALQAAQKLVKPGGSIYITQTYASTSSLVGRRLKPLIRYLTTIDFGQLVTTDAVLRVLKGSQLEIVAHEDMQQTNAFGLSPPAYLTKLKASNAEEPTCEDDEAPCPP